MSKKTVAQFEAPSQGNPLQDYVGRADLSTLKPTVHDNAEKAGQETPENPETDNNLETPEDIQEQIINLKNAEFSEQLKTALQDEPEVLQFLIQNHAFQNNLSENYATIQDWVADFPELAARYPSIQREVADEINMGQLSNEIKRVRSYLNQAQQGTPMNMAFNLKKYKTSQLQTVPDFGNKYEFVNYYLDRVFGYQGQKEGQDIEYSEGNAASVEAINEILSLVASAFENDARDLLKRAQESEFKEDAAKWLEQIYPMVAGGSTQQTENVMADKNQDLKTPGLIRYSLSDHILNNNEATVGMKKTAGTDHFGESYILYGPSEKRICPLLAGKQVGSSVVSEYTCRHHCLQGIVIDDNKTICGEALWRGHVMDKFAKEYVDKDGNIVGGYLNKRFEINRNVPEENKMRLKPGETRKSRPPQWGNTESRLQAMRKKEGQSRGYRPDVNTGEPFQWCTDVDQNNVEQTQEERDRREEAMGHKTVQYTNKTEQENKPKVAFNLKNYKNAQMTGPRGPLGPDNPQSDDLGPSPDSYDPMDDLHKRRDYNEPSPLIEELISEILGMRTKEEVVNLINAQIAHPETREQMGILDWDEVVNAAVDHLQDIGQPEFNPEEINFPKDNLGRGFASRSKKVKTAQLEESASEPFMNILDAIKRARTAQDLEAAEGAIQELTNDRQYELAMRHLNRKGVQLGIYDPDTTNFYNEFEGGSLGLGGGYASSKTPSKEASLNDMETEKYDFAAGNERAKNMSIEQLKAAIKDIKETIEIQEKASKSGYSTPKLGYYWDELHTYLSELNVKKSDLAIANKMSSTNKVRVPELNKETSTNQCLSKDKIASNVGFDGRYFFTAPGTEEKTYCECSNCSIKKEAKSPEGWKGTITKMKEKPGIDNEFALANYMKNKGDEPHYTNSDKPKKKEKFKNESESHRRKKEKKSDINEPKAVDMIKQATSMSDIKFLRNLINGYENSSNKTQLLAQLRTKESQLTNKDPKTTQRRVQARRERVRVRKAGFNLSQYKSAQKKKLKPKD